MTQVNDVDSGKAFRDDTAFQTAVVDMTSVGRVDVDVAG
jgi:hypothetical protein